jgi:hypothetical protein
VDVVGGHNATLSGPTWTTGKYGTALSIASGYASVPHHADLSLTTGFTVTAWINKKTVTGFDNILIKGSFSGKTANYHLRTSDTKVAFGFHTASGTLFTAYTSGITLKKDIWYHVAATYNGADGQVTIYIDAGPFYSAKTFSKPTTNSQALWIGKTDAGDQFDGLIDDVRIFNYPLTSGEVGQIKDDPASGASQSQSSGWLLE